MTDTSPKLDHVVVAADTLAEGVQWCEQVLGVTPGPGGQHPLMGTHNRLARIASPLHPAAYLEIIAIDPSISPTKPTSHARWFDLDNPALQTRLRTDGPQLVHWVARVGDLPAALQVSRGAGIDIGEAVTASRPTPSGLLSWSIAIRSDGRLQYGGVMPTLIGWGGAHPTDTMADSGLSLQQFECHHPDADRLNKLFTQLGSSQAPFSTGIAGLSLTLKSPLGLVTVTG
jgi:hypothetical protein